MKNFTKIVSVLALFISSVHAQNIGVVSSKIDWNASELTVTKFVPADAMGPAMSCFGETYNYTNLMPWVGTATASFSSLGFNSVNAAQNLTSNAAVGGTPDCFHQAGTYTYYVKLVDNAGNEADNAATPQTLVIKAGNASVGNSDLVKNDCLSGNEYADGSDACELTLTLKDSFSNILGNRDFTGDFLGQNIGGNYDTISDANSAFLNGLRFVGGTLNTTTGAGGVKDFMINALVPTMEIISSVSEPDFTLYKVMDKTANFSFFVDDVDEEGNVNGNTTNLTKGVDFKFKPFVMAQLSDNEPDTTNGIFAPPSDPLQFLFKMAQTFWVTLTSEDGQSLPTAKVFVQGFAPSLTEFKDLDLDTTGTQEGLSFTTDGTTIFAANDIETMLYSASGTYTDLDSAFGTIIEYDMGGHTVRHPSVNLGISVDGTTLLSPSVISEIVNNGGVVNSTKVSAVILGADIEGNIMANLDEVVYEDSDLNDLSLTRLGNVNMKDLREQVFRQAYNLTGGLAATDLGGGMTTFDLSSGFGDDEVVKYFKNGLVFIDGGTFLDHFKYDGKKRKRTILIEDGNLFISGDLSYKDLNDSLGIILINTKTNDYAHGNIFVDNDVHRMIGTYFADGGFISREDGDDSNFDLGLIGYQYPGLTVDVEEREKTTGAFNKQLILEGTLFTKNTLGGYLLDPVRTPFGEASTVTIGSYSNNEEAILYDLHFLRRYAPQDDTGDTATNPDCVPKKDDASKCDNNIHSFVVRPDQRVKNLTPPGFESDSMFSR